MTDPIISPDGKWIWMDLEWIPAPSAAEPVSVSRLDSVIAGDVTIIQKNAESIAAVMVSALERIGFPSHSDPAELTPSQEAEVEQVLEISKQLTSHGIDIDPWAEIKLGNAAAKMTNSFPGYDLSRKHYLAALEEFQVQKIWIGEIASYIGLTELLLTHRRSENDLRELETMYLWIVRISEQNNDKTTESSFLWKLGLLAEYENNIETAEEYYQKVLNIDKERGIHIETAISLSRLGKIAEWKGELDSSERLFSEVLTIFTEYGEEVDTVAPLTNLAFISFSRGELAKAGQLFGTAQVIINSEKENKSYGSYDFRNWCKMNSG
jgi:tetratricopeptide (TPR) repeat protein